VDVEFTNAGIGVWQGEEGEREMKIRMSERELVTLYYRVPFEDGFQKLTLCSRILHRFLKKPMP